MELFKVFSRIGLGLLLIASGAGLLYNTTPARSLQNYLEDLSKTLIVAKYIIPYSLIYYKVNAGMFIVSGMFALVNSPFVANFYAVAAVMFGITYDNPMLSHSESDKNLRYVYLACHVCIFACLSIFAGDKAETERKQAKAEKRQKEILKNKGAEAAKNKKSE